MTEAMKSVSLGDVSTVITSGSRGWAKYYASDGSPFIRMTNLRRGGIALDLEDLCYVSLPENSVEAKRTRLKKNDILVSITAELGKIGFVRNLFENDAFISQHVCLIRLESPEIDNEYAAYLLASEPERRQLNRLNDAGAKAGLNLQTIARYRLTFPPLPEQRKIAEILRTWDEAIEKLETLRALKAKKLEHLSWRLIHGDLHQEVRLQDLLTRGVSIEKGTVLTRETSLSGPYAVIGGGQSASYSHCRYTHKPPCITVSASGAYAGFVWRHREPIWASDCNVLTTTSLSLDYLFFALKTQQKKLYSLQSGGAQPHIYSKDILSLKIPLPPDEMQEKIAKFLNAATEEVVLLNQQVIALTRQKRGLMQKLLTGEWRVTP